MSTSTEMHGKGGVRVRRRNALLAAGATSIAALVCRPARAATGAGQRSYEGESAAGNIQEALDAALAKVSADLGEGGVSDGQATWTLVDVTGRLGGITGARTVTVRLNADRTPPWLNAPGK